MSIQIPPDPTLTSTFTPVQPQHSLTERKSKPQSIEAAFSSHNNLDTDWEMEVTTGSDRFTEQHHFSTQSSLKVNVYHFWQLFLLQEKVYQFDWDEVEHINTAASKLA